MYSPYRFSALWLPYAAFSNSSAKGQQLPAMYGRTIYRTLGVRWLFPNNCRGNAKLQIWIDVHGKSCVTSKIQKLMSRLKFVTFCQGHQLQYRYIFLPYPKFTVYRTTYCYYYKSQQRHKPILSLELPRSPGWPKMACKTLTLNKLNGRTEISKTF